MKHNYFPEKSEAQFRHDNLLIEHMKANGFTQIIIVGINDRDEYVAESKGEGELNTRVAKTRTSTITAALRDEGLTVNLKEVMER